MNHGTFGLQGPKFDHRTDRAPVWWPPTGYRNLANAAVRWPWQPPVGDRIEFDWGRIFGRLSAGVIILGLSVAALSWFRPSPSSALPALALAISLSLAVALPMNVALKTLSMGAWTNELIVTAYALAVLTGLAVGYLAHVLSASKQAPDIADIVRPDRP